MKLLKYQFKVFIKPEILNKNFIKVFIIVIIFCLFSGFFGLNRTFATENESNNSNASDSTLSITLPSEIDLSILPTAEGKLGSESFDITVSTDNPTGYALSMSNESSNLVNDTASAIIPTLDDEIAKTDFPVNRWGYSLDDVIYKPILEDTKTVLKTTEIPNDEDITTFNLATKINTEKPAGSYTNTFVFNAVANQSIFTVTWDANGGAVSPSTSDVKYDTAIGTLPTPTYDGHNFLGWFTEAEGGEEVTAETRITKDVTYYARWEEANLCDSTPSMQNIANLKNTLFDTEVQQIQLCDERDGKLYWAAKLKDGNIWMTQNLDYNIKATGNEVSKADGTTTTWDANPTYATDDTTWDGAYYYAESYDPGNYYIPSGTSETPADASSLAQDSKNLHWHQGNYYNWYAATAGSNAENMDDDDEAPQSICPKGWRLPYSGRTQTGSKSWTYLKSQARLTGAKITTSPVYIPRAGNYYGSVSFVGSFGYYWSSTANGSDAYFLSFDSVSVHPQDSNGAVLGFSMRCVAL